MMRALRTLFLVGAVASLGAGCGGETTDPCAGQSGACLAIHVQGDVGPLDAIRFDFSGPMIMKGFVEKPASGQINLPAAVAVLLPDATGNLTVVGSGIVGTMQVGGDQQSVAVTPGGHESVTLVLKKGAGASCSDGIKDNDESDVDCGGSCSSKCADGKACNAPSDCAGGTCMNGVCSSTSCTDGKKDGDESDVDCGGSCNACDVGKMCLTKNDCASGVCFNNTCLAPTCSDGVKNGSETDKDCGGTCPRCATGQACMTGTDCMTGVCMGNVCVGAQCNDGLQNGDETDVDCGGSCMPCAPGLGCKLPVDCTSGVCTADVCATPTCSDMVKNGSETDTDCGGSCPGKCMTGQACAMGSDCQTGVCTGNVCVAASCSDGIQNGGESDVDCGGPCGKCADGKHCASGGDCTSAVCSMGVCTTAQCVDGVKNGSETDVDCGGGTCPACATNQTCVVSRDCQSLVCSSGKCAAATCSDTIKNGSETDVDCGGTTCTGCATGKTCLVSNDCQSKVCSNGTCQASSCTDGVKNGTETDTDCGGTCSACATGKMCAVAKDCLSGVCSGGVCQAPNCMDMIKNGSETDVDCGGTCQACGNGKMCVLPTDCQSLVCSSNLTCATPSCSDGVKNGSETDVDCGGSCANKCGPNQHCSVGTDCSTGVCSNGVCASASCSDGIQNGTETDTDCGGSCPACPTGKKCNGPTDCQSLVCTGGTCQMPSCSDGVKNGAETAVDCGSSANSQCLTIGTCPLCMPCLAGKTCGVGGDCQSLVCVGGVCQAPSCSDGIKNGAETDVDCGSSASTCVAQGTCPSCPGCANGHKCTANGDCQSNLCQNGTCIDHCTDGVVDFGESDVDCGGSCAPCATGKKCNVTTDCQTQLCQLSTAMTLVCAVTSCGGCQLYNISTGQCSNATSGTDPKNVCNAGACTGANCNSMGTCFLPSGTTCGAASCSGNTLVTQTCDASGGCGTSSTSCGNFNCVSGACKTACAADTDCNQPNYYCIAGTCVLRPFAGAVKYPSPASSLSDLTVDDFNRDGLPDVIAGDNAFAPLRVWIGAGNGSFGAATPFSNVNTVTGVRTGDLNRDGVPDLSVSLNTGVNLTWQGNGDGTFSNSLTQQQLSHPARRLALGDVNNDGKLDQVDAEAGAIECGLGNGDLTFQPTKINSGVTTTMQSLRLADINRDGKLDVVAADEGNGTADVFLGNGDCTFQPVQRFGSGSSVEDVIVGDLNHDGKQDIVMASLNQNSINVLLNASGYAVNTLSFQTQKQFTTNGRPVGVALGDFNLDGKLDVAVSTQTPDVEVFTGNGDGTFKTPAYVIAINDAMGELTAADLDRDGDLDLAILGGSNLYVALNQAHHPTTTSFSVLQSGPIQVPPNAPVVGDFYGPSGIEPGDGLPDLIWLNGTNTNQVFLYGTGTASGFSQLATTPSPAPAIAATSVVAWDFDQDGRIDYASMVPQNQLLITAETLAPATNLPTPVGPTQALPFDYNRDGKEDVLVVGNGQIRQYTNGGVAVFTSGASISSGAVFKVASGDFNRDGFQDLVGITPLSWCSFVGGVNGLVEAGSCSALTLGNGATDIVAADFNNDGRLDFAISGNQNTVVEAVLTSGFMVNGAFATLSDVLTNVGANTYALATADYNLDGFADLAVDTGGTVKFLIGKGDGTFTVGASVTADAGFHADNMATIDVDLDGKPDLLWGGGGTGVYIRNTSM